MNQLPRFRLTFIVLALCAVLSIVPLASAQSDPLPMPGDENASPLFSHFGQFDKVERSTRAPIGVTVATLDGMGDSITVTEDGVPGQFTMRLNEQPAGTVNLRYGGIGTTSAIFQPRTLTFTPDNWDTPQVVSVYGMLDYFSGDNSSTLSPYSYPSEIITDGVYDTVTLTLNRFTLSVIDSPRTPPTGPLVVTTLADSITEEIPGSLRQAMLAALARPEVDTITFDPALAGTIQLVADLPWLPWERDFSILGSGQSRITIDGAGLYDGFIHWGSNYNPNFTIRDLTLSNFSQAIWATTNLFLSDVTVLNSGQGATLIEGFPAVVGRNATIARLTMEGNSSVYGGALGVGGDTDITDSTFINNTAHGLVRPEGVWAFGGGAIYIDEVSQVDISRSTFAGNAGALAGAIADGNSSRFSNPIKISNSTFSGNFATQPDGSAAVNGTRSGFLGYEITFSTFSGHNTGAGSGGVLKGSILLTASVIANNSAANPVECVGGAAGGFLNFSADPACNGVYGMGVPTGVDPVLRNNGGLTMTHALLPGSNVINSDFILPEPEVENLPYCQSPLGLPYAATDQRGVPRPQFGACDFGAFESDTIPLPPVNLLINPSFETAGATENEALGWTTRNLRPIDRRWCGTSEFPETAPDGSCTFRFRGPNLTAAQRRLIQTVEAGEAWGEIGDTLTLLADVRTREWGAASRLMLTVTYTDGTTETAIVRIPSGTNEYQTLTASLTLAKPAQSATVLVRVKTGGTKKSRLWVDNVILVSP